MSAVLRKGKFYYWKHKKSRQEQTKIDKNRKNQQEKRENDLNLKLTRINKDRQEPTRFDKN